MFDLEVPAWELIARSVLVYGAILVGLRVAGKRELGQMAASDLVVILLIANAVQNAMVGSDTSLLGGLIAAATLLVGNFAVAFAAERVPQLRRAIEGTPTLVIHDGQLIEANLKRESVDFDEVMMALREHGVSDVADVQLAVLEIDGTISVVPRKQDGAPLRSKRRVRQRPRS